MPFLFRPPEAESVGQQPPPPQPEAPIDVTVRGVRENRTEDRSASDFRIERDVLMAAPRREGADVLYSAPGVYIGRAEGPAVAHNYMLRGFDADHGQDIEFRVGGLPINIPSHIHGQGYSDLGFLIGDTIRALQVAEGVYDPRQGDFAVVGSIDLVLGVENRERGVRIRSGYGSWNTFRQLVMWAPREASEESFGAIQYMHTDGFGENRSGQRGSGIFQHRFGTGDLTFRVLSILHATRSNLAGVVRRDDVDAGKVCFTCVYPYPTARAKNAMSQRFLAGVFADYAENDGANGQIGLWFSYDNFRIQENYTGFLQESRVLERVAGRGDLIEQRNRTVSVGLTGRYRTSVFRPVSWSHGTVEVGADGRLDIVDQTQNLIDAAVRNQTWDRRVDASIRGADLGLWGDLDWTFTAYLRARVGLRADILSYDIEDRLGNFVPLIRPQDAFIPGFRRSALGLAWGPRTSVEARPIEWLSIQAAYGEGYRSPQARLLEDGERTPFSKVRSADLGVRFDWGDPQRLTVGGFYTRLSDDVAFDAAEGRPERLGATQRLGAVAHAVTRLLGWLVGSFSFTFVDATVLEPPPPSAEEPQPPFVEGQNLPFVPPIVIRTDLGARHTFVENLGGQRFGGRAGLGFSFLSPRPLPYRDFADSVALFDASAGLSWGPVNLGVEVFNVLNTRYAALEYAFPSDWDPNDGHPSANAGAAHSRRSAPVVDVVAGGDAMRRHGAFALLVALGAGCAETGQDRTLIPLFVAGTEVSAPLVAVGNVPVTLDRSDLAFGPLYLCAGATAGDLCETARLEWLETIVVDTTVAAPARGGELSGVTGAVRSWMYDLGISSQLTHMNPFVLDAASDLGGASLVLEGRAIVDGVDVPFSASVPVQQTDETELGVPVVRKSTTDRFFRDVGPEESGLVVRFGPSAWAQGIDFRPYVSSEFCAEDGPEIVCDGVLERVCDNAAELSRRNCSELGQVCVPTEGCAERLIIKRGSEAYRSLRNALASGGRPSFEWDDFP